MRYNTVRWVISGQTTAIGPSRVNPKTGEIYDADILVDESWLKHFAGQYEQYVEEAHRFINESGMENTSKHWRLENSGIIWKLSLER